jgi:hypothetical protein
VSSCKRDRLNEFLEAFSLSDGCATFLAYVLVIVLLVVGVSVWWASCT